VVNSGIVLSDKCYVLSLTLWGGTSKLFADGKQGRSTLDLMGEGR